MENYKQENKSYTLLPNLEITDVNSLDQIFQFCFKSSFYFKSLFLTNQGLHTLVVLYTDVFLQSYECFILLKGNCHFFFFLKLLSRVQLFATPWIMESMKFSRPEYWSGVAHPFSRGSSQPKDQTQVSCIAGRFFTSWTTRDVW